MIDVEVSASGAACALPASLPAWAAGLLVRFSFAPEWAGLAKTVYISNGSENVEVLLARDDEAVEIPTELLDIPHAAMLAGVRGKGRGKTLGTFWCQIGTVSVAMGGSGIDTSQFVTKHALANYYTKPQTDAKIITRTDGAGDEFLAADGTYKMVQAGGDPPDLSAYATTAAMNAALATKADQQDVDELDVALNGLQGRLADKASQQDVAALQGKVEANIAGVAALQAGKADKADLNAKADVSAIPDVSQFVTGQALGDALAGKANAADIPDVSGFVTDGQMQARLADFARAEDVAQALAGKADASAIPNVSALETVAHAEATYARKEDVPNVSGFVTSAALASYARVEDVPDVSALASKQEVSDALAGKADAAALASYALKTDVPHAGTFATKQALQEGLAGKADASAIPDVSGFVTATAMNEALATKADVGAIPDVSGFATKGEIPDVSALLSSADAQATYATQDALAEALAGKVNNDALQYYETVQHAMQTWATKAELLAKADAADIPDVSGLETTAHAQATYAAKTDIPDISALATQEWVRAQLAALTVVYEGVEYLQSQPVPDNRQYIDTGITPDSSTKILLDAQLLNTKQGYRMAGTQKDAAARFRVGTHTAGYWLVRFGASEYTSAKNAAELAQRHVLELEGGVFKIDGEVRHTFPASNFTATGRIFLFAINDTALEDNASMKLYSCKIWQGEELVRDFVPCYHKFAKIAGLYDRVEGGFYANLGAGEFSTGAPTGECW